MRRGCKASYLHAPFRCACGLDTGRAWAGRVLRQRINRKAGTECLCVCLRVCLQCVVLCASRWVVLMFLPCFRCYEY